MKGTVDIVLATYNGERFLPELLRSIEAQTCRDWRLILRDDGSSDRTSAVIEAFRQRHGDRVRLLRDGREHLGASGNFAAALEASDADYFMFCDQDDVWLPEKISALLRSMREVERQYGAETPVLVHSDLIVVDDELKVLHPSFWRYSRLFDPAVTRCPQRVMLRNFAAGCAMIGNAALRRTALPVPSEAQMHDWWVALVAAILGKIVAHEAPTVLYRQHQSNQVGAHPRRFLTIVGQIVRAPRSELQNISSYIVGIRKQTEIFKLRYNAILDSSMQKLLSEFIDLPQRTLWRRKLFLFKENLWPDYWISGVALWLFL